MSTDARISVLLPVHNGMPLVRRAVESILVQTLGAFELVVIDDGSTDETPGYLRGLDDPRVKYHRIDKGGTTRALNRGLELATAPLVARMDADDVALPGRLARQAAYLDEHPDCVLVGCQAEEIDAAGTVVGRRRLPVSDTAIRWQMMFGCPFLHPAVMFRREAVLACGGYDESYPCAQDYELWTRLAAKGTLANLPDVLLQYRVHPESVTSTKLDTQIELSSQIGARWAGQFAPGVDEPTFTDLYYLAARDRTPQHAGYEELIEAFRRLKRGFFDRFGQPDEEVRQRVNLVQQNLRWHCLHRAEAALHKPWEAWSWLRRARQFDPEGGTLVKILARKLGIVRDPARRPVAAL